MSKPNDGGPAFPVPPDSFGPSGETARPFYGMSLRAHFASQALQGILRENDVDGSWSAADVQKYVAQPAVMVADALIRELSKETP